MWSTEGGRSQTIDPDGGCRGVELLHGCVYVLYTQYKLCALQVLFPLLMVAELQFWAEMTIRHFWESFSKQRRRSHYCKFMSLH